MSFRILLVIFALTCLVCGCGKEVVEAALCRDASQRLCDKQFSCFPVVAAATYKTKESCYTLWRSWCDDSEAWTGCDVNNSQLASCRDGIASSACGQYPASCTAILNCYQTK
jgi:hypothetical protein